MTRFVDQFRLGKNEWWRTLFVLLLVCLVVLIANFGVVSVFYLNKEVYNRGFDPENFNPQALGIDLNLYLFLMLVPFVIGLFTLLISAQKLHQRNWKSFFIPINLAFRTSKFVWGATVWFILMCFGACVTYLLSPERITFQFELSRFFPNFIVLLLMLPFQVCFEEVLTRGYLLQVIKSRWSSNSISIIISGLIFGLLHLGNSEIQIYGVLMVVYYAVVGCFLGYLAVHDNGLELPIAIHLVTNIFCTSIINLEGSALQADSVFKSQALDLNLEFILFILQAIVFYRLLVFTSEKYTSEELKEL